MRKFLSLFSCWLLLSGSISQAPPAAFPDVPTITETSVGKARIGMPVTELRKLYSGYTFTPAYFGSYGYDEFPDKPDAIIVSKGKSKLFLYYTSYDTFPNRMVYRKDVAVLIALHPAYVMKNGIHVGSTSEALLKAVPTIRTAPDAMSSDNIQIATKKGAAIEYGFLNQPDLGPQRPNHYGEDVPITIKTGKISWIVIHAK
ncbi:hypothetical protein [Hymenobacter ruber]